MHFTCRSFIGHQTSNSWSQYWENEPDDSLLVSRRGHLFGLINFDVTDDTDTSSLGHELINEINQYYFSSTETDAVTRLKSVLTDFISGLDFQFSNLSLILIVVLNGQLHLVILNSGRCLLQRGLSISSLSVGQKNQVIPVSGPLLDGDRLLFCTEEFFQQFTFDKIKNLLVLPKIQDLEENFLSTLYAIDDQHGLSAVFIMINTDPLEKTNDVGLKTPDTPTLIDAPPVSPPRTKLSFLRKLFSRHSVYISHHENTSQSRRKKINIFFSLLVLAALSVSIFIGYRQNQSRQIEKQYQELKTQAELKLNNAKTVKQIDLSGALVLGKEALAIINNMANLKIHSPEVDQLRSLTTTLLSQTGSADNYTPEMFFDTSIISNSPAYSQIILSKDLLYLLDGTNGRIDIFDISHTSTTPVSSGDFIKGSSSFAVSSDQVYVLNNKQIFEVQKTTLIPRINLTEQITNFVDGQIRFWNGSLYLLVLNDQTESTIRKFSPSASGFSPGLTWLKDKQTLPVDTSSFAINGKVWVLSKNGTIAPFTLGNREDFKMSAGQSLDSAANITTSPDTDLLAFSSNGNLVHIYQKDGQAPLLYNLGSRQISSLAIDPTGKFVYVLCQDQKIYRISL